ncbi:MAG: DUF3995 domain-containing protein [Propionibacteriales bacterium]|nr:DUF3995 domain-containing protein [Propionibacteriales bacterium]
MYGPGRVGSLVVMTITTEQPRRAPAPDRRSRLLTWAGALWALQYIPIHVYWAMGGTTGFLGIEDLGEDFQTANWAASVVIAGAGLVSLSLVQSWGRLVPSAVRHGLAWVGGIVAIVHGIAFAVPSALRLAGVLDYRTDPDFTSDQLRNLDWANLLYFEPWFTIMGILLIVGSQSVRRHSRDVPRDGRVLRGTAYTLLIVGIFVAVWGVFTFDVLTYLLPGVVLTAAGFALALFAHRTLDRKEQHR